MVDDEHAVRSVLAGDREAFRGLVVRHQSAVCATIRALRPRSADWEDLAQEVFLAAYRRLETFDSSKGTFRVWLLAISRNRCRDMPVRRDELQAAGPVDPADHRTPELLASEAEWFEKLDSALATLPDEQRLSFVLVELQGLSYQQAADAAGIAVGTLKSRLSRAKEWMREVLKPLCDNDESDVSQRFQSAVPQIERE